MLTSPPSTAPSVALAEALLAASRLRDEADQPIPTAQALAEARRASERLRRASDPFDLGHAVAWSPEVAAALEEALRCGARLRAAGEGRALVEGV